MASGLAGKVRRATESDEFDLSGYDQAKLDLSEGFFFFPRMKQNKQYIFR